MQPGQFNPSGEDAVIRRIQELERKYNELSAANPFKAMGIRPMPDGLIVDGYETVDGPLDVNGTMNVDGNSTFNGSMWINGPLFLQPGSIQNDALTSPTATASGFGDASGFAVPAAKTTLASATIPVPAGYTKATVTGIGAIYIYNSKTTADFGYGQVHIDWPTGTTNWGANIPFGLGPNGGSGNSSPNRLAEKTGLSGGSITVRIVGETDGGVPAHVANQATINTLVLFTR